MFPPRPGGGPGAVRAARGGTRRAGTPGLVSSLPRRRPVPPLCPTLHGSVGQKLHENVQLPAKIFRPVPGRTPKECTSPPAFPLGGRWRPRSRRRMRVHKTRPGVPSSGALRAPDPPRGKQKSTASSGGRPGRNLGNKNFLVSCTFPCNFSLHSRRECRDFPTAGRFGRLRPFCGGPGAGRGPGGNGPAPAGS